MKQNYIKNSLKPILFLIPLWFFVFIINRLKLSNLQFTWSDEAFFFILLSVPIACICSTILFLISNSKISFTVTLIEIKSKKVDLLLYFLISVAFILLFYEFSVGGFIPILTNNINESRVSFGLDFYHIISEAFIKLSATISIFLLIKYGNKKYYFLTGMVFFYFILTFSRSGIIELLFYSSIVYITVKKLTVMQTTKILFFGLIFIVLLFTILGTLRQGDDFSIIDYSELKINNQSLSWLYGYYFINLDNVAIIYDFAKPTYNPSNTLEVFINTFQLDSKFEWFSTEYDYIGKLNLGTFMRGYLIDWGPTGAFITMSIFLFFVLIVYNIKHKSELAIVSGSYILTCVLLFPLTNRLNELIPLFIIISVKAFDKFIINEN